MCFARIRPLILSGAGGGSSTGSSSSIVVVIPHSNCNYNELSI